MSRLFSWFSETSGPARWLRIALVSLALLNAIAIYLYILPPGGSRRDLVEQDSSIQRNIQIHRVSTERLKSVSAKVQLGGQQTEEFAQQYFLPNRTSFAVLVDELLRMSNASGLREGQRTYSQEPIEGTDDLSLLSINASFQGNYADLMKFVNQVDHSKQLLILDTLTAVPQQQGSGVLNIVARFLAVEREDHAVATNLAGVRQ
jgi:Tfp pilus assembly protein PilO